MVYSIVIEVLRTNHSIVIEVLRTILKKPIFKKALHLIVIEALDY